MLRGIDATKSGMMSILEYNDNIAHSLANVNTTAFKQTKVAFRDIHESMINSIASRNNNLEATGQIGTLSQGAAVDGYNIDFTPGPIKETGRTFDFAINGDGFFKMRMADGTYQYSRNGIFQVQTDGTISDTNGNVLMNKDGVTKINIKDDQNNSIIDFNKVMVTSKGEVYYSKTKIGKIDLYDFSDKSKLMDMGEGRFISTDENANPAKLMAHPNMQQGSIELSNANPILTLINSMSAQRAYESMSNVMQANSQTLQKTISTVGRPVG